MKKAGTAVVSILGGTLIGTVVGMMGMGKLIGLRFANKPETSNKYLELFLLMNQWVKVKQQNKNLCSYFERAGYKKIAIYGMSSVGITLLNELRETGIEVAYGIDKRADEIYAEVDIVTMEEDLNEVDAIVVTAISFFDEIKEKLGEKVVCPVVSLNDVLYEI